MKIHIDIGSYLLDSADSPLALSQPHTISALGTLTQLCTDLLGRGLVVFRLGCQALHLCLGGDSLGNRNAMAHLYDFTSKRKSTQLMTLSLTEDICHQRLCTMG